ncbi:MAG: amino acid racemase [Candidatus Methanomethyliaceae archaeon]
MMVAEKTVGIIGGMGPEATVELFRRIVRYTPAQRDQDHLHILIDNNPKIPDRTKAILGEGPSPLPALISSARRLQQLGADFLVIPCNTAHYWLPQLCSYIDVPILDMVQETTNMVASAGFRKVGLLATTGTVYSGVYHKAAQDAGIVLLTPSTESQQVIMHAIYSIKAGNYEVYDNIIYVIYELLTQKAEAVILGCTELSILLANIKNVNCPLFDALDILAQKVVRYAKQAKAIH